MSENMEVETDMQVENPPDMGEESTARQLFHDHVARTTEHSQDNWVISILPPVTTNWTCLPLKLRQSISPQPEGEQDLARFLSDWKLSADPDELLGQWTVLLNNNISKHASRRVRPLIKFAMGLAKTHPSLLPRTSKSQEGWTMPANPINAAWLASVQVFGHPTEAKLWDKEDMLPEISTEGRKWREWNEAPFVTSPLNNSEELFVEGPRGIHDPVAACRRELLIPDEAEPTRWEQEIKKIIEAGPETMAQRQLLAVALRLVKSPPNSFQVGGMVHSLSQ